MKTNGNPMQLCGAHCRQTGQPCQNYPMTGRVRCRLHGGMSTGRPQTTGNDTKAGKKLTRERGRIRRLLAELRRALG